jgi:hypothetical protein
MMMNFPAKYEEDFRKSEGCKSSHDDDKLDREIWAFLEKPENIAKMIAMAAIGEPHYWLAPSELSI